MKQLVDLFKENKALRDLTNEAILTEKLKKNWSNIFGNLASQLELGFIRDKTLTIFTKNPSWKTELNYYKQDFIEKTNKILKRKAVSNIKVVVK